MPSSYPHNISRLLATIIPINPRSIYDVGVGYGKWGTLLREYLDNYDREVRIDGCEIFAEYIVKAPPTAYDAVDIGDWLEVKPLAESYDLVLMIDVLEHFSPTAAVEALEKALTYSNTVLISTPIDYPQGVVNGNEHERHISEWTAAKLERAGFTFRDMGSDRFSVMGLVVR